MPSLDTPEPVAAVINVSGFALRLTADDSGRTTVDVQPHNRARNADVELAARTTVDLTESRVVVRSPRTTRSRLRSLVGAGERVDVRITVPSGSSLEVRGWGDVNADGPLGEVDIDTAMGDIDLDRVGRLRAKTSMGDIRVAATSGDAEIRTSAGSIRVGGAEGRLTATTSAGDVSVERGGNEMQLSTSAGDVRVDQASGSVTARTSAGDIRLHRVVSGTVAVDSTYGQLDVGVAHGTAAWLDLEARHGAVRSELEQADGPGEAEQTVEIRATAGYGDIVLRRA